MTLLDRYFATRTLVTFGKVALSLLSIFVVVDLTTHRQSQILSHNVPAWIVAKYYICFTPAVLFEYQVAAIAMLLAGLIVFGRAAQDSETIAALAGGISLRRMARSSLLVAAGVTVAAFAFEETLGVYATQTASGIEREYFKPSSRPDHRQIDWANLGALSEGEPSQTGWTCHIRQFQRDTLTGQGVLIHRAVGDVLEEIRAERIWWNANEKHWILEEGQWSEFHVRKDWEQVVRPIHRTNAPFNETPSELFALEEAANTKTIWRFARDIRRAERLGIPVHGYQVEYHAKIARPALCFIMVLLAIPFAIRLRRGGPMVSFGLSILIGLAYLGLFLASVGLGHWGKIPPAPAAWLANVVFLGVGIVLFKRTPT